MTKTNLKSEILENINNIALGVRTDSNARLNLAVQLQNAESTKGFEFLVDVNDEDSNDKDYVAKFQTIHQLNKIGKNELKYLRDTFQQNFLQVKWKSTDKDNKPKIDALRDAIACYVPMSICSKTFGEILLKKDKNSFFTGANNSKIRVNGSYVHKYCEPLNKDNVSEVALTFAELLRVARGFYKAQGLSGDGRKTPFDIAIERATNLIFDDYNAIKPFNTSSAKSKTLINFLTVECNKWSSAYNDNQVELKKIRKAS